MRPFLGPRGKVDLMLESDVLYAYLKRKDRFKEVATKIIGKTEKGDFGKVYTSREVLHELYYVSVEEGVAVEEYLYRMANLTSIKNLVFLDTNYKIDLLALSLISQYKLTSIFDAYYAATCLNQVDDHMMVSTDSIYDKIPGIKKVDPRELVKA